MKLNLLTNNKYTPDPYIIKINGGYYIYASSLNGVRLFSTTDLLGTWVDQGLVITKEDYQNFWAPTTIVIDEVIYTYFSMRPLSSTDIHDQKIYVATATNPLGPYEIITSLVPPFSIDPHVVLSGGELFMYYSINVTGNKRPGTLIVVDKMLSPTRVAGNPQIVIEPTLDEEIFMRDRFNVGENWHTIEGAFYFRKDDYHYLMYSGNSYKNEYYFIGYAVAYGAEDDLTKLKFTKMPSPDVYAPLLAKNHLEMSTGHNSVLFDNNTYYIVYHARDLNPKNNERPVRSARIARLFVTDGILYVDEHHTL